MIYGFYFRFYNLTRSKYISIVLSCLARFVFFLKFLCKRILLKKEALNVDSETALKILKETSPKPVSCPDCSMEKLDEHMDLSIVVPVYNHSDVLEKCINSLLEQNTGFQYELILVDDGSTDGAQDLIEKYRFYGNVQIIHKKNGGIAEARNTGLCHCRGKYIMFADCDDYVHDDIVETLLRTAKDADADISMCAHALVKLKNKEVISRIPNVYPQKNLLGYTKEAEILNYAGLPWGKAYRRELFEQVRFFPGYWYEDTIIHSLIFTQCKKFSYIPEVKYEYQWYEGNFSHIQSGKMQPKSVDRYWLLEAILVKYENMGLERGAMFYTMLLKHLSAYYYRTIDSLPESVVQAMFVAGRDLLLKYRPEEKVRLPYMLRLTERAMIEKDIALWKLCSVNQ